MHHFDVHVDRGKCKEMLDRCRLTCLVGQKSTFFILALRENTCKMHTSTAATWLQECKIFMYLCGCCKMGYKGCMDQCYFLSQMQEYKHATSVVAGT